MKNDNWIPEISSGHIGHRCRKCGTWRYLTEEKICYCNKIMKNKKYKVEIPEGYEVSNTVTGHSGEERISTTIVFKPIKKELPKTWEEYCNSNKIPPWLDNRAFIPEKHTALGKLEILRDHYNDGWKPDWKNGSEKQTIRPHRNKISCRLAIQNSEVLSFKNESLRDEFLSNFAQLIEEAKPLL